MKLYTFLADGFETVEALGVIDILRRGKVEVCTVSIMDTKEVISSHNIPVIADKLFSEVDFSDGDALFLPGGVKGSDRLEAHEELKKLIMDYQSKDKYLAAICAAPGILGHFGILNGKKATCYPGFEDKLLGTEATGEGVVVDGKVITGKGMGKTIDFGLKILELFTDKETSDKIGKTIQYL